jgi:hypothetical protein
MKKLTASLGDTLGSLRTTAREVSAAAATQLNRTLGDVPRPGGGAAAGPGPGAGQADGDRQYLRLPVDSARKLRWYDKGDAAALTRQHVREKHALLDTITALKKARGGVVGAVGLGRCAGAPVLGACMAWQRAL